MQAPNYTPQTDFSDDEANNTGGRSTVRTDRLDAELDNISLTANALVGNLALIQRDDGKLQDGLVEPYNLSSATKAFTMATKWNARGLWATATVYAYNDMVDFGGKAYICAIAHTSGVFATDYAAGKWQLFSAAANAASVDFTQTTTISATDVQSAIVEVDTENRALSNPTISAFYGGL